MLSSDQFHSPSRCSVFLHFPTFAPYQLFTLCGLHPQLQCYLITRFFLSQGDPEEKEQEKEDEEGEENDPEEEEEEEAEVETDHAGVPPSNLLLNL